jgi:hypothetical protein
MGTQVPDSVGTLATGLSVTPGATKGALLQKCNQNMQNIILEFDNPNLSEKRREELNFLMDKNQAVRDALSGKPENLRRMIRELKDGTYKPKDHKKTAKEEMKKEEKKNMEDLLARYRKKVEALKKRAESAWESYRKSLEKISGSTSELIRVQKWVADTTYKFDQQKHADFLCEMIKQAEEKAKAYAVSVYENEKKCNRKIEEAAARAAACKKKEDGDFVISRYEEGRAIAAGMEKDLGEAQVNANLRDQVLKRWTEVRDKMKGKPEKREVLQKRRELTRAENDVKNHLNDLNRAADELIPVSAEVPQLKKEIIDASKYYIRRFPESKAAWRELIDALTRDAGFSAPKPNKEKVVLQANAAVREIPRALTDLDILANLLVPTCQIDDQTQKIIRKAVASRDAALLNLAANEHLLAQAKNCGQNVASPPQGQGSGGGQPPGTPTQPGAPTQPLPGTTPPQTHHVGGLFIKGPNRLHSGEGTTFKATDGAGKEYRKGITWNSSVEDVVVIDRQTGQATAFKAGMSTVIARLEEQDPEYTAVAYYDVAVFAGVPNLIGMTSQEALGKLAEKGLKGVVTGNNTRSGKVVSQSIAAGTSISSNTSVSITLEKDKTRADTGRPSDNSPFSTAGGGHQPPQDASGFSTSGGEAAQGPREGGGRTAESATDCQVLKSEFRTAMQAGDTAWADSVLNRSVHCDFYNEGSATLVDIKDQKKQDEINKRRARCDDLLRKFNAAMSAGNIQAAQSALNRAGNCPFYASALANFNEFIRKQRCRQYRQQFYASVQQNNTRSARNILNAAQQNGCPISQQEIQALQQADARNRQRTQQQTQQFLNALQGIIQNMPQRRERSSSPPPRQKPPAVTTPSRPPAGAPTRQPTRPPANEPRRCKDVCVKWEVKYFNVTDGRHGLCKGKTGKVWTGAYHVTCEKENVCVKWEKRCE